MRLDFNVLWVDDQPEQLTQFPAIARQMREHGFEFQPTLVETVEEVRARVGDNVFADNIDLIVVDWELRGGLEGQQVIAEIRETIPYKDVIFYSSLTPPKELRAYAADVGADGIYPATKRDIIVEVMNVFETLVKKVLDLDHTRGIVMGATSDIDLMVKECLGGIHGRATPDAQQAMLAKAQKIVADRIKDLRKTAEKLAASDDVGLLLEAHALFTANDKLRVLKGALAEKEYDDHDALRGGLQGYIENVVPMRNDLGHVVFFPTDEPGVLATLSGKTITVDDMRALRTTLLDLRADFRRLKDEVSAQG